MSTTLRYLNQYLRPDSGRIAGEELFYRRSGEELPATLYRPPRAKPPVPGWVVLHGLTYRGREHPSLVRFARAVAASGSLVYVPEIPEWRALNVAPAITLETIRAAILALDELEEVASGRVGVIGFSFGATQALVAGTDPRLQDRLAAIVAWGGYCDLPRLFRFGITGEHELDDLSYRTQPDPYGAWIMGANYLTRIPEHEGKHELAAALHTLASEAGRRGAYAWEAAYDPLKLELRERLPADQTEVFDLFAPPAGRPPHDMEQARAFARDLAAAAAKTDPLLDPGAALPDLQVKTLIAHGWDDRLVPFTEATRLERALAPAYCRGSTVTRLFAHSGETNSRLGPVGIVREGTRLVRLLRSVLNLL